MVEKAATGKIDAAGRIDAGTENVELYYPSLSAANYGVVLLFVVYVLSFLDRHILSLLVGPIREQFGITDFQYSLLAGAAFAVPYSFSGLPLGRLVDRSSRQAKAPLTVGDEVVTSCSAERAEKGALSYLYIYDEGANSGTDTLTAVDCSSLPKPPY